MRPRSFAIRAIYCYAQYDLILQGRALCASAGPKMRVNGRGEDVIFFVVRVSGG